ncbi:NAD(P)H-binding protein [Permianibacter sp. IMCC34836]|uniref:saccharopine dehydrogenase family protein n=1 Tax=Permianibacter fluminis TaxID=2738515 RepID=UPI001557DECE|nr:saccharopine dehydrogenase NADP-binding domain-containing protein [Permianibacter fluminis]NQD36347.1 NAD(P)H-binding protein [Permianibacter fluminis]
MSASGFLIYGANGYTGELIARQAKLQGLQPVLAGRNRGKLEALANELGFAYRVFALETPAQIAAQLTGIETVLHCAGPFSATAAPMMAACLQAKVNYLDITGEISVFEHAQTLDAAAKQAGVVICPGVGFDVVPTDCVASALKAALPDATQLALGFDSRSSFSPGTAKTSVEGLAQGGKIREGGVIKTVPLAAKTRRIDFGNGEKLAMTIPWGDVSTAYHSTGIPNIEVYIPASPALVSKLKRLNWIRALLGLGFVQAFMKKQIEKKVRGPSESVRSQARTYVWGEARNASGASKTARIEVPNGYTLTVHAALAVVAHLEHYKGPGGAFTPSRLVDANLICRLPGAGALQLQ